MLAYLGSLTIYNMRHVQKTYNQITEVQIEGSTITSDISEAKR